MIPLKSCVAELTNHQAFQELAKGERTATVLESKMNDIEAKIEELLAQAEREQNNVKKVNKAGANADGDGASS
jgi:hypothetical protein